MAMVAYFTLTGQTKKFIDKVAANETYQIEADNPFYAVDQPFILVIPTYVPEMMTPVFDFLETKNNIDLCQGIYAGGNRNFADLFCFTAYDIEKEYDIPVLHTFEFQGSSNDVDQLREELTRIEN